MSGSRDEASVVAFGEASRSSTEQSRSCPWTGGITSQRPPLRPLLWQAPTGRSVNEVFEEIKELRAKVKATDATPRERQRFDRLNRFAGGRLATARRQIKAAKDSEQKRHLVDRINREARAALQ
ncbi:hypothetical protein ACFL59_09340 [Planctomycetota bacterium]